MLFFLCACERFLVSVRIFLVNVTFFAVCERFSVSDIIFKVRVCVRVFV